MRRGPSRRQLLASTAALLGALTGYGRSVYGQVTGGLCTDTIATGVVTCTGSSQVPQSIDQGIVVTATGDLAVSVATSFLNVDPEAAATDASALSIRGYGGVSFVNTYQDTELKGRNASGYYGLSVTSSGDSSAGNPGGVTIETNGLARGGGGIEAQNEGTGSIEITVKDGNQAIDVEGQQERGIFARNSAAGESVTITTEAGSVVQGRRVGIRVDNEGTGATTVTANGDVTATLEFGIFAIGLGADADGNGTTVTTGAGTTVAGRTHGIVASTGGGGETKVIANGDVTAGGPGGGAIFGILAGGEGDTTVETAAGTEVTSTGGGGIGIVNNIAGTATIIANGDVTATGLGIAAEGRDVSITTGSDANVTGRIGITARSSGTNSVTTGGNVIATGSYGIDAENGTSAVPAGTDLTVTTGAGTLVRGLDTGIRARNYGSGVTKVEANSDVTATGGTSTAIYARGTGTDSDGNSLIVTTGAGTTVTGGDNGIDANNFGSGALAVTVNGAVVSAASDGGDAAVNAENNSLSATSLTVTTGAESNITSGFNGIRAINFGTEAELRVDANGYINGLSTGIAAVQNNGADLVVTTGADSNIIGQSSAGIRALSFTDTGAIRITVNGDVTGSDDYGIYADHRAGGEIFVTSEAGSTITGGVGLNGLAIKTEGGPTNLTVAGAVNGGDAGAVQFDQVNALDDRLELRSTAAIDGNVLAGGGTDTLAFGGDDDGTFDLGAIDTGAGTQQFQDFETFQVESGTWNFSGATTEAFTATGGTVAGTGTFGGLTIGDGATLAPGNSIGTMIVNGAFNLNPGAIYEVEVNAAGESDRVMVMGTVNLTGATLNVLAEDGDYQPRTDYTIIDNDGNDAVEGEFAEVNSNLAFLTPSVDYEGGDGNDVVLTLSRSIDPNGNGGFVSFCSVAETSNECNVATALDAFPTDNPLFLAVLNQTAAGARQAFNALSGEVHATVAGTLAEDSRYAREAVLSRLMQASHDDALGTNGPQVTALYNGKSLAPIEPERARLAFWTQGFGAWGDTDSDGNAASASRDLGGFISGIDADIGSGWRAGVATGASFSSIDVSARASSADVETYHLGGYLGGMVGGFALRGGGLYAWNSIDTSRAVIFPGFFERQNASYDADTGQLFGEIAYPTQMGGIALEPFGGLAFVSVDTDSFRERGGALASLRGNADQDVGYTTLGLRAATTMQWGNTQVTPHISAAWQHAFDDVTPGASLAFASTGIGFGIDGVPLAEDSALIDAGLDFALGESGTAGVSYTGQFGDGVTDNAVTGRVKWVF